MHASRAKIIELDETNTCKLCDNALAKYSCPKCGILYCSLACYQSEAHLQCSEQFYKDFVLAEMNSEQHTPATKARMQAMLNQYNLNDVDDPDPLDSDDEETVGDLADRLTGVDLDNTDSVWDKLTEDERQEFISFLKTDDVTKLIPSWVPWWTRTSTTAPSPKVQPVDSTPEYRIVAPPLIQIEDFAHISKKEPADCVRFNLVNVVAAYAFTARYFNGEYRDLIREAVTCAVTVSLSLRSNVNFDSWETAVKSVEMQCTQSDWIVADLENYQLLRNDVTQLFQGPCDTDRKYYIMAALSDLYAMLDIALNTKKNEKRKFTRLFPGDHFPDVKMESRTKIKGAMKKIDYLLSYVKDKFIP